MKRSRSADQLVGLEIGEIILGDFIPMNFPPFRILLSVSLNRSHRRRPRNALKTTLLDRQTTIPPPPPPRMASRDVPEVGYTPRGRWAEKRTCSRPGAPG